MPRILSLLLVVFFNMPHWVAAQIFPKEGSVLNYRLVGFSSPTASNAGNCKIEIAAGYYSTADSFRKNIISSIPEFKNRLIAEVPAFGSQYTWRVVAAGSGHVALNSALHHFSTMMIPEADTNNIRLRITVPAAKYKDAFVFLDATGVLYDMKGRPVWFLPGKEALKNGPVVIRDMKMTLAKTITFSIDEEGGYEIDYSGNILWRTPHNGLVSGDDGEHWHHEFTRLSNGHYMALAQEFQYWKKQSFAEDSILVIVPKNKIIPGQNDTTCDRTPMATIIEYDAKGKVVWSWKSSDHLVSSDLFYRGKSGEGRLMHAHENSFFFDEKSKNIYLSCRNLARIIKLKYPAGNIERVYGGDNAKPGTARMGTGLFCGQHSCKISRKGYLYLYNNNLCNPGLPPSVVMMKEPVTAKESLKKIWEFQCPVDTAVHGGYPSGGNVAELPGNEILVSMAYPDSKVFITGLNKEILWSSVTEKWNASSAKWESVNLYRASIIPSRKELEALVWNAEKSR
jgi:hypothetical protein